MKVRKNFDLCYPVLFLAKYIISWYAPFSNETFTIEHVAGRGWQLQVFNRWGKQVYSADNYQNDWDGQHLLAGVYYYLLKNQPLNRTYRGWVHLLRNPS